MYHTKAWLAWLATGLVMGLTTTNPFYLILLAAVAAVNFDLLGRRSSLAVHWQPLIRFTLFLSLIPLLFNPLFVHEGETVLFHLPTWHWFADPEGRVALLTLGGPITLESLTYGAVRGMSLISILIIFATFNILANPSYLLRSLPKSMYQMGVVTSIAISFVPQMTLSLRDIREAQMVRGHRFRSVRDLLVLFMPLLTIGLERAMQLAESMEARGFSRQDDMAPAQQNTYKSLIAVALLLVLGAVAWLGLTDKARLFGWVVMAFAAALIGWVLRAVGQRVQRSRYLTELWRPRDTRLLAFCLVGLAIFALFSRSPAGFMGYYPYPRLHWPGFNVLVGIAILALIGPAVLSQEQQNKNGRI